MQTNVWNNASPALNSFKHMTEECFSVRCSVRSRRSCPVELSGLVGAAGVAEPPTNQVLVDLAATVRDHARSNVYSGSAWKTENQTHCTIVDATASRGYCLPGQADRTTAARASSPVACIWLSVHGFPGPGCAVACSREIGASLEFVLLDGKSKPQDADMFGTLRTHKAPYPFKDSYPTKKSFPPRHQKLTPEPQGISEKTCFFSITFSRFAATTVMRAWSTGTAAQH